MQASSLWSKIVCIAILVRLCALWGGDCFPPIVCFTVCVLRRRGSLRHSLRFLRPFAPSWLQAANAPPAPCPFGMPPQPETCGGPLRLPQQRTPSARCLHPRQRRPQRLAGLIFLAILRTRCERSPLTCSASRRRRRSLRGEHPPQPLLPTGGTFSARLPAAQLTFGGHPRPPPPRRAWTFSALPTTTCLHQPLLRLAGIRSERWR